MGRTLKAFHLLLALIAAATLVIALAVLPARLTFKGGESYTFYLGDTSLNCKVVTVDYKSAPLTRLTLKGVSGESATYTTLDVDKFLKEIGGEIVFEEELSDSLNYYCKAPLPYFITLYGEEINLHVCVKENGVTVASPIIFGGY